MPSLIRVFAVCSMDSEGSKDIHADGEDSDQADLSLRLAHMSFYCFCHAATHIIWKQKSKRSEVS